MREGWINCKLEDISSLITKGTTPSTYGFDFEENGEVNFIRAEGISKDGRIDSSTFLKISRDCNLKLKRSIIHENDILFSIAGMALGKSGLVKSEYLPANTNQAVAIIRPNERVIPNFLLYYIANPSFYTLVNSVSGQAAQPNINLKQVGSLPINLPPLETQKKIASILSGYDDLIENNLKRIKILEQMAQQTYEEWFVRMRFPGHETVEMNKETGLPEGWTLELVGKQLAKVKSTLKIKSSDIKKEGAIPVIDQSRDFIAGFTYETSSIIRFENTPFLVFGDHTRVLKLVNFDFARGADGTQIIVSNNESMPQHLFYFSLRNIDLSNYHYARHFKYLKDSEIVIPTKDLAGRFEEVASTQFIAIRNLQSQNQRLREARDILLPRLMMGMIEV